jgi:hypothetical protein
MKVPKTATVSLAVAVAIAAALVPVSLQSAGASTTACGSWCTSPTNEAAGTGEALTVSGSSVVMAAASTTSSGQDWAPESEGSVTDAVGAGVVPGKVAMLYGGDTLFEFQYAPNGVPSDQCLSDGSNGPGLNTGPYNAPTLTVVLAQCGITAQSLWIMDETDAANGYVDLINAGYEATYTYLAPNTTITANSGADTLTSPFAEPAVLTVNSSGKVVLAPLSSIGQVPSPAQMWADNLAPAQSALAKKLEKAS